MSSIKLLQIKNLPKNPEKGGKPAIEETEITNKKADQ